MSSTTSIHPDKVLDALLSAPRRANVKRTLNSLHDLCRKYYQGGFRNFTLACIGRKAEHAGLFSYRSLYNNKAQAYRDLIQAWASYSGPSQELPSKVQARYDFLMKIQDPAVRILVQQVIAERDTLKFDMNLLKGTTLGTIDMRPLGANIISDPESGPTAVLMPTAQLTPSERKALLSAISPKFLEGEGWIEGERGEIKDKRTTRIVFEMGFSSAIRKLLG
ncbi:MAG: hypothetical protein LWW79_10000 [Holophagaceae bacterium]|nr:hypothetical protein [Holophagaceae bacterium]